MELDTLRTIWKEVRVDVIHPASEIQIPEMLDRRSQGLIARMRRNLFWELIAVIVSFGCVVAYYFIGFRGRLSAVSWVYLGLALAFAGYFYFKNKLLRNMQCVTCMVKTHLQLQVRTLEKFIRLYLVAGTLLIPLLMILFYWLLHSRHLWPMPVNGDHFQVRMPEIYYFLATILITAGTWYLNKWYLNRLYGRHVRRLKGILDELNDA